MEEDTQAGGVLSGVDYAETKLHQPPQQESAPSAQGQAITARNKSLDSNDTASELTNPDEQSPVPSIVEAAPAPFSSAKTSKRLVGRDGTIHGLYRDGKVPKTGKASLDSEWWERRPSFRTWTILGMIWLQKRSKH